MNLLNKRLTIIATVVTLVTLPACAKKESAPQVTEPKVEQPARPVRVIVADVSAAGDTQFFPGEIRPRYEQRLGFRVGGKLATRKVEVGEIVKAGQLLATLDSQDVAPQISAQAAQLEAAKANTKLQQSDLQRQKDLRDKGFISAAAMQRQEIGTETAIAQEKAAASGLANAQNALAFQSLRADRNGVVVGIDAEVGSVVGPGQSVLRVAQLGEKELVVNVPERAVGGLKSAAGFQVMVEAAGQKPYRALLRELAPVADATTRTYVAKFSIPDADDAIKLGMSGTLQLAGAAAPRLVVPLSAITTRDGQTKVWVVDRITKTVQPIAVTTDGVVTDGIAIRRGIEAGQIIVTAGANLLVAGQKVRLPAEIAPQVSLQPSPLPAAQK